MLRYLFFHCRQRVAHSEPFSEHAAECQPVARRQFGFTHLDSGSALLAHSLPVPGSGNDQASLPILLINVDCLNAEATPSELIRAATIAPFPKQHPSTFAWGDSRFTVTLSWPMFGSEPIKTFNPSVGKHSLTLCRMDRA